MPRHVYSFDDPDRFIVGTVGEPGSRTFYLQAREGSSLVSVVLEKVQVAALAERLRELLDEVRRQGLDVPAAAGESDRDQGGLEEPVIEAFRVGAMAIVWDGEDNSLLIEARALDEDEESEGEEEEDPDEVDFDSEDGPDMVRVRLEPGEALAFADLAMQVVDSGRPPCPFCGQPLNPEGHICARRNGYMH